MQVDLDHVAVAVERWEDAWPVYRSGLGAGWHDAGEGIGFAPNQLRFADGFRVEVLRPAAVDRSDFLRRFLDRRGPGPHHLTFLVDDLDAVLATLAEHGFPLTGVDRRTEAWQEAFVHPHRAHGVLVQVAQADKSGWVVNPAPEHFPEPVQPTARLEHITHAVADVGAALRLFAGALQGEPVGRGDGWVELAWPGPGRLRLVAGGPPPGRVQHLSFAVADPSLVPGAVVGPDGWTVPAAANHGTALVLRADPALAG